MTDAELAAERLTALLDAEREIERLRERLEVRIQHGHNLRTMLESATETERAAVVELLAEVEQLRGERDHFREAWAAAQVRIDLGTDALEAVCEERDAVVTYLLAGTADCAACMDEAVVRLAREIERGEHRREEER